MHFLYRSVRKAQIALALLTVNGKKYYCRLYFRVWRKFPVYTCRVTILRYRYFRADTRCRETFRAMVSPV